jgi:hypothetical protein
MAVAVVGLVDAEMYHIRPAVDLVAEHVHQSVNLFVDHCPPPV